MYRGRTSSFTEVLQKDSTVNVHQRDLQVLATKLYNVKTAITPDTTKELFPLSTHTYDLRSSYGLKVENTKTINHGTSSLSFTESKIWELVPLEIESYQTLEDKRKFNLGFQIIVLAGSAKLINF